VGDNIPEPGIFALRDALKLAEELELDLVEISPKAEPPVCKITDYSKFLYQQKKKQNKNCVQHHLSHSKPMKYIGFPRPSYPLWAILESVYQQSANH